MKITGQLKMVFDAKVSSIAYLQKYDFKNMQYTVDKLSDIENLIRFLIFRDLEKDTTGTLVEILNSYINRDYAVRNPMYFCYKLFKFLDYIPDVNTFINVLLSSDDIYNFIKNNLKSFYNLRLCNDFCDNLFTAYQIVDFNRRNDIPDEIQYLYENVKHTKLLTSKEELEYTKEYVQTRDINYRNALIIHYQRLIFDKIIIYHNLYHISYEELIDLGNKVLYDSINTYNLNYPCSLSNLIRNRFTRYIEYLLARKSKSQDSRRLTK